MRWHRLTGAGPFFVRDHIPIAWAEHAGRPAVFDHSTALGQWGPLMLELVQHHEVTPGTLDRRVRGGGPGINHVAWFVDDLDGERARLVAEGADEVMVASTGTVEFAFLAPPGPVGHLVEVYEPVAPLRERYRLVHDAANGWNGRDPVREMP